MIRQTLPSLAHLPARKHNIEGDRNPVTFLKRLSYKLCNNALIFVEITVQYIFQFLMLHFFKDFSESDGSSKSE